MPFRTVSRETSTPFGAAFHSNRRDGPRITGTTRQQDTCLAYLLRRMACRTQNLDVSRGTPGCTPVLQIGLLASLFWRVVRGSGRNWLGHHPFPRVTSGGTPASARSRTFLPVPSSFHTVVQPGIRKSPGFGGPRWALRHAQARPLRAAPPRRGRHHGRHAARRERPQGVLPCPCLNGALHRSSSPAPCHRRVNLRTTPGRPQALGVARVRRGAPSAPASTRRCRRESYAAHAGHPARGIHRPAALRA